MVVARLVLGYRSTVRWLVLALVACGHPTPTAPHPTGDQGIESHSELAPDDGFTPTYGKPDLEKALITERAAEASGERQVAEAEAKDDQDALRVAQSNLAVRRRFIASLEACQAEGRTCPPRLDDPPWTFDIDGDADPKLDSALRGDVDSWRAVGAELHGRACACRTLACVDSMDVAIARMEAKPSHEVLIDDAFTASITRARECLFRLRGERIEHVPPPAE